MPYNSRMSESADTRQAIEIGGAPDKEEVTCDTAPGHSGEATICERCGKAERCANRFCGSPCPECGFKTDCCGW